MSLPTFLLAFAGLVVVHEGIHALVHPMAGLSPHSILGFWASLGFYAHYDGEMSRNRLVASSPNAAHSFERLASGASAIATRKKTE